MQNLEFEKLIELLHENIVNLKFTKINGEERVLNCTLSSDHIPTSTKSEQKKRINDSIISVWSVDDKGWRSFRKDSVINFEIKQ
jgi:hypothetical protein